MRGTINMARSILDCTACVRRAVLAHASLFTLPAARSFATAATTIASPTTSNPQTDAPRDLALDGQDEDPSIAKKRAKERLETVVKKHMRFMSDDPWAVGQYVEKALARDAYDEALLLVQKASRGKQMVVAWNHLIDYQLNKQQLKQALKLFNDMKKRAQLPNVRTFTVLFRGLAKSQHPKLAVAEAVKHYNVLLNDARLEPNSIHLNAVLNVCARAGDLDNLWLIVDSVNESTRAPTAFTYTTILNALRHSTINETKDLPQEQKDTNIATLLSRAKGLWEEVIRKWTDGRLVIDEELVCAMGRLLLMSPKKEQKRQIFDLLEQTMSIPNLLNNPDAGSNPDEAMSNIAVSKTPKRVPDSRRRTFATPGTNTLALILTTLATTKHTTAGIKYWNLMVRHYGIVPDMDIWLRLFGLLKVAKSSAHATSILEILPAEYMNPKPFAIAMETCVRDNLNPNVIKNANRALDTMLERLDIPDLQTLRLYLRISLVSHNHLRARARAGEEEEAKRLYGTQITEALGRLWEPYKQAHYHYFKASRPATATDKKSVYNGKREVIALARHMVSAFDKVTNEKMLPEADLKDLRPISAKISREIQNFMHDREKHEPNLPSAKEKEQLAQQADQPRQKETDEFAIKYGPEWVWDTYKAAPAPSSDSPVAYPWESTSSSSSSPPEESILGPSRTLEKRPERRADGTFSRVNERKSDRRHEERTERHYERRLAGNNRRRPGVRFERSSGRRSDREHKAPFSGRSERPAPRD